MLSVKAPGSVSFTLEEVERINDAQLILIGIDPRALDRMPEQLKHDVLAIHEANNQLSEWRYKKP